MSQIRRGDFPRKDHEGPPPSPPPSKCDKTIYWSFTAKSSRGLRVVSCLGALMGPRENPPRNVTKPFILDFNCQSLGRVPICFMPVGPLMLNLITYLKLRFSKKMTERLTGIFSIFSQNTFENTHKVF